MSEALVYWIIVSVLGAAFGWYFVLPWVPPLYARYKAWVQKVASGK